MSQQNLYKHYIETGAIKYPLLLKAPVLSFAQWMALSSERRYQLKKHIKNLTLKSQPKKMNTKKDTTLKIRISTQDKETIRATASKQHKTISTYVRDEALKSPNR